MKTAHAIVATLVLAAALAAGGLSPTASIAPAAEVPDLAAPPAPAPAEIEPDPGACPDEGLEPPADLEAVCGSCPHRCSTDAQCDAFCGGPGTGACVMVNSCCRQCSCFL